MTNYLPLDGEKVAHAAKEMIAQHGDFVSIQRQAFVRAQYGIVTTFLFLSLLLYLYEDVAGVNYVVLASRVFDIGKESSLPSWFSSFNLLLSAGFLLAIFARSRTNSEDGSRYWLFLGLIFLALSIDEVASIHERASGLRIVLGPVFPEETALSRILVNNHWVIYGAMFSFVVFVVFIPFLRKLPRRTAGRFLFAGAVFVSGALGFEFLGSWMRYEEISQPGDLIYNLRRIFEEGGELYGVVIFNCALFDVLVGQDRALTLRIGSGAPRSKGRCG